MDVSLRWLRSLAPGIEGTPQEIADRLALLGFPVDEVVPLGAEIRGVVVARVEDVRPHPNADRLRVCTVNAGELGEALQVVCGAPNVEAGRLYPFAPVGAELPGGIQLRRAKIRGETSNGMLCSAKELGLGRDHAGILALHGDWAPGTPFVEAMGLDDWRLAVDVTPNRGDLFSHLGVARELAPGGEDGIRLAPFPGAPDARLPIDTVARDGEADGVTVSIEDPDGCGRFLAAVVRGVRVGPSPEWLAMRLRAVGLRPINNVVDATNHVMMELGQPLHAYDLATLRGGTIRARAAADGEAVRTLDGQDRALAAGDLVIADGARVIGVAGVMGGEETEVGDATVDLLIECAHFDARRVRKTRTRLGLSTDASQRFERGVDPEGGPDALRRVVSLILAVAGGRATGAVDVCPRPYAPPVVPLRPEYVERILGVELAPREIADLLRPIGFGVNAGSSPVRVTVPGFRTDVTREADLVEEIARRRGYDTFSEALLPYRPTAVPDDPRVAVERRLQQLLVRWGFLESRTLSFAPPSEGSVAVLNPLSAEDAHLRTGLLHGLLRRVEHNLARGVRDVRLFTIGTVFRAAPDGGAPVEEVRVAAAFTGARMPLHWSGPSPAWDAWDLRALLDELAAEYPSGAVRPGDAGAAEAFLAPDPRFALVSAGATVGGGGRAADGAADLPAWAGDVWLLEATVPAAAADRRGVSYRPVPELPASERDLALLVPRGVAAGTLEAAIREAAGPLLEAVFPFDRYEGKGLPEGTHSLAWRLRFRAADRTLTDAEVDGAVARVLEALEAHGVRRR